MKVAGAWECPVEEQYAAPAGFYDVPYIYAFDYDMAAAGLFTAAAPGLQVPLDGDSDFILRRVAGAGSLNTAGALGFQMYDSVRRRFFSNAIDPSQAFNLDIAIAPEKVYPASGQIWFDIAAYNPAFRASGASPASGIFWGQMALQGVRRFAGVLEKPTYQYTEKPFSYMTRFTLNWNAFLWAAGVPVTPTSPVQFVVPVNDYDFELLGMVLCDAATGAYPAIDPPFKMTLYDKARVSVMKRPILSSYLFMNEPVVGVYSRFPSPGIVYPAGSQILIDIHSLLMLNDYVPVAPVYDLTFLGVRRVPV